MLRDAAFSVSNAALIVNGKVGPDSELGGPTLRPEPRTPNPEPSAASPKPALLPASFALPPRSASPQWLSRPLRSLHSLRSNSRFPASHGRLGPSLTESRLPRARPGVSLSRPSPSLSAPGRSLAQIMTSLGYSMTSLAHPKTSLVSPMTSFARLKISLTYPKTSFGRPKTSVTGPKTSLDHPMTACGRPKTSSAWASRPRLGPCCPADSRARLRCAGPPLDKAGRAGETWLGEC